VAAAGQLSEHGRVDELLDDHLPDGSEPHRDFLAAHALVAVCLFVCLFVCLSFGGSFVMGLGTD
jgi:hypothetical protein